jgi:hypothetical protein
LDIEAFDASDGHWTRTLAQGLNGGHRGLGRSGEGRKAGTCQNGAAVGFGGHVLSYFFPISKPLRGACQTLGPGRPGC